MNPRTGGLLLGSALTILGAAALVVGIVGGLNGGGEGGFIGASLAALPLALGILLINWGRAVVKRPEHRGQPPAA